MTTQADTLKDHLAAHYKRQRDHLEITNVALTAQVRTLEEEVARMAATIAELGANAGPSANAEPSAKEKKEKANG